MTTPQERYQEAMKVLKDPQVPLSNKLVAHEHILRFGMAGSGDGAKLERMAEALGDVCLATALILTFLRPSGDANGY